MKNFKNPPTINEFWYDICKSSDYPLKSNKISYIKQMDALFKNHVNFKSTLIDKVNSKHWLRIIFSARDNGNHGLAKHLRSLCGVFYRNAQQNPKYMHLRNPITGMYIELNGPKTKRIFTLDQLRNFKVNDNCVDSICKIMLLTGQRISEVLNMKWDYITDSIWIVGKSGELKNKNVHHLPLTANIINEIGKFKNKDTKYVFENIMTKRPFLRPYVVKWLQKSYPNFTPHCFRHSFATHATNNGIDLYGVSLVLNNDIPGETYNTYIKGHDQQLEKKFVVLNKWESIVNANKFQ